MLRVYDLVFYLMRAVLQVRLLWVAVLLLPACTTQIQEPLEKQTAEIRAEDNYYQIINGSLDTVNDGYVKDRGYSVYFNFEGSKFLLDAGKKVSELFFAVGG